MNKNVIAVPDMSCSHCVGVIGKALEAVPGLRFAIDLGAHRVVVAEGDPAAALAAIQDAGYEPELVAG